MSRSFPFNAEEVVELIAALPRAASDLMKLSRELQSWRDRIDSAAHEQDDDSIASGRRLKADAVSTRILSAEGGGGFSRTLSPSKRVVGEPGFLTEASYGDTSIGDPSLAMEAALASLERSAEMMREIVEETRHDRLEFEIRRRQIDRTLTRIDNIFDSRLGLSQ